MDISRSSLPSKPVEVKVEEEELTKSPNDDRKDRYFSSHLLRSFLLFTMATLAFLVLSNPSGLALRSPFVVSLPGSFTLSLSRAKNISSTRIKLSPLDEVLLKAAMADKTVILSPLNEAWIEKDSMFDVFLESFRIGNETSELLKHLVVVALDQKAFDYCLGLHTLNCYFLNTTQAADVSEEAHFMSATYLNVVWIKIDFLRSVLEKGYSFIFTDADIMWFRNPFPRFYLDTDFQVACDAYNGNPSDLNNHPNTGYMYIKSSNRTVEFFKLWYKSRETYPTKHDQDAFNMIKFEPIVKQIGLTIKFLNTAYFGGFCQPSRDLNLVCTMHANCCAGLDNKIHDLKIMLGDWKNYLSLPKNVTESHPPSWTVPQLCGPRSFGRHTPRKKTGNKRK